MVDIDYEARRLTLNPLSLSLSLTLTLTHVSVCV